MTTIHHMTLKLAAKHGIEIASIDEGFRATFEGYFAEADSAKDAVNEIVDAIKSDSLDNLSLVEELEDGEDEATEEDGEEKESRSIVKAPYRKKYRPHHDTNGDQLATDLAEYLADTNEDGEPRINRARLESFARANGFWQEKYSLLNNGQTRMNVGNRLRAALKKNPNLKLVWPK